MEAAIVQWFNGLVGAFRPWDEFMKAMVSDYLVPVTACLTLFGLWFLGRNGAERARNQFAAMTGLGALGLANMTVEVVNDWLFRPRPFVDLDMNLALFYPPTDSSFPSNPAATGFAVATGVFLWNRPLGMFLYALAFLWAIARMYAGVHYPTDLLAGAAIGIGFGLLVAFLMRLLSFIPNTLLRILRTFSIA